MKRLKLLFVGATWNGSDARSLRDALSAIDSLVVDDIGEDHYYPKGQSLLVRATNKILRPKYRGELAIEILSRCRTLRPDIVIVYKGSMVAFESVRAIQALGIKVVNVFPDASPHAHGKNLKKAIGQYDLVISTKPSHPEHWAITYGYSNPCVCVPHGYNPAVHYWPDPPRTQDIDVAIAASWRPQYESMMIEVGKLMPDAHIAVALAGPGWAAHRDRFPTHWQFPGARHGLAYGEFVRRAKIVIAPVNTQVVIAGRKQPGDQETTRTYELAAAGAFFLHRRTPFASQVYTEGKECVFWSDASELVKMIRYYLPREQERRSIASAAHRRAVPEYSAPARAKEIVVHLQTLVAGKARQGASDS